MRKPLFAAVLAGAALGLAAAAAAAPGFVELFKQATAAAQAGDHAGAERALREALKLRPGHPTATYKLAAALAQRGEKGDAVDELVTLARMGLTFDAAGDPAFAALKGGFRFDSVASDFRRNARPAGDADVTFRVPAPGFAPHGLAWDDDTESFFLGSARLRRIERIDDEGRRKVFAEQGLWAVLGLAADEKHRRLWVATAALPEMERAQPGELGRSAIVAFDLDTGAEKHRFALPDDGRTHAFADLTIPRDNKVYVTDSAAGVLYALDLGTGKYEALTEPGALSSPRGIARVRGGRYLYVADHTQGLYRYDLDKRALLRVDVARDISVYGIDGLYRDDDDLVAVQNGIRPHRIVRFTLDRNGRRVRRAQVLAAALAEFDEPALGVVDGSRFHFVANGNRGAAGKEPVVMNVRLDRRDDDGDDGARPGSQSQPGAPAPTLPQLPLPGVR